METLLSEVGAGPAGADDARARIVHQALTRWLDGKAQGEDREIVARAVADGTVRDVSPGTYAASAVDGGATRNVTVYGTYIEQGNGISVNNYILQVSSRDLERFQREFPRRSSFRVPPPTSTFTGRTTEIETILRHVRSPSPSTARVVVIWGMPGCGRTELARYLAYQLKRPGDAGVFLSCGGRPHPAQAMRDVMLQIDPALTFDEPGDLRHRYADQVAQRKGVLILDDVLDYEKVAPLLPLPAGWTVLITAEYERSGPPDALALRLGPLQRDDAVQLLRALLALRQIVLPDDGADAELARTVERCGGLPLALELAAAAFVRGISPDAHRAVFAGSDSDKLRRLLGASLERVRREDRELAWTWHLLTVVPAPFDVAEARAVIDAAPRGYPYLHLLRRALRRHPPPPAEVVLAALDGRSLLRWTPAAGHYDIHRLLRDYAGDHRPRGWHRARRRAQAGHRTHVLGAAQAAEAAYRRGERQQASVVFDRLWPHVREYLGWLADPQARVAPAARRHLAQVPVALSGLLRVRVVPDERIPLLERGIAFARQNGMAEQEMKLQLSLGHSRMALQDAPDAMQNYARALELWHALPGADPSARSEIENARGSAELLGGRYEQAEAVLRASLLNAPSGQARLGIGVNLALALTSMGRPRDGLLTAREALAAGGESRDALGLCHNAIGDALALLGDAGAALAAYSEAGDLLLFSPLRGHVLHGMGEVHLDRGELDHALQAASEALLIGRDSGHERLQAECHHLVSLARAEQGDWEGAGEAARTTLRFAVLRRRNEYLLWAGVCALRTHRVEALQHLADAEAASLALLALSARNYRAAYTRAKALLARGILQPAAEVRPELRAAFERALSVCTEPGVLCRERRIIGHIQPGEELRQALPRAFWE